MIVESEGMDLLVYNVYCMCKYTFSGTYMQQFACMCLCTGVCTYAFIGLCAKRSNNLIAVQRVSTCDSRYTQTLDQYLDRLSDNDSSGRYRNLLQYVCLYGLWTCCLATIKQFTVQKLNAVCAPLGLTPLHSLCPLTTLTSAVGLISQSSLITWNQTLKEGGSQSYS